MRKRDLKPGFFKNEDLATLPPNTRLLFAGLWCLADREGRLEDRPTRIRAEVFPYHPDLDVSGMIDALEGLRHVARYSVNGGRYLWIPHFKDHQRIHPHEAQSILPEPPKDAGLRPNVITSSDITGNVTQDLQDLQDLQDPHEQPTPKRRRRDGAWVAEFDLFWSFFPYRVSKGQAEKTWAKLHAARKLPAMEVLRYAVKWQSESGCLVPRKSEDGRDLRPHPSTWLNSKRWEDSRPDVEARPRGIGAERFNRGTFTSIGECKECHKRPMELDPEGVCDFCLQAMGKERAVARRD